MSLSGEQQKLVKEHDHQSLGATGTKHPVHTSYIWLHSNTRPRNNTVGVAAKLEKIVLSRLVPHIPDNETKHKKLTNKIL